MAEQVADLPDLLVGIDLGTTTAVVSFQWSGSKDKHLLQFPSPYTEKRNEELDATVARSQSKWYFGRDVRFLSDVIVFENIKLGIIGQQPYKELLTGTLRAAAREHGVIVTPVNLFEKLFAHILEVLEDQFLDPADSEQYCRGRSFHEIPKRCWVTYPVRHNESLRIMLVEAALAAGFDGVNGVSESLAAAYFVKFGVKQNVLTSETMLIVDCGGGSTDAAAVYFDSEGRIKQACPTDGFNGGGQMINDAARAWLREQYPGNRQFEDDGRWASISSHFEGCKRVFDGISPVKMDVAGQVVTIGSCCLHWSTRGARQLDLVAGRAYAGRYSAEMTEFFQPLKKNILQLVRNQHDAATHLGHPPGDFVLCGGPARNRWFAKMIFDEIQQMVPGMMCAAEVAAGTVAKGALGYAQNPVTEISVAREDIGLTYLEDHSPKGLPLGGDRVEEAIGWVIEKGQPAGPESRVELIKNVYRGRPGRPNRIISTEVYATTDRFPREKIEPNERNEWNCRITYPITGLRSHLNRLGNIETKIPHDILFPSGTSHDRVEARFIFSIRPEGQLLKVEVALKREGDTPLILQRSFVPAASWTPESEMDVENKREHRDELQDSLPTGQARKRGRPKKKRKLTLERTAVRADSPMPHRAVNTSPRVPFAFQPPRKVSPSRYAARSEDPPTDQENRRYVDQSGIEDEGQGGTEDVLLPRIPYIARRREMSL